ncbi:MAG: DUF2085 domain-containing protein [Bacteroidetes bacterium]|nr:DUF2085 domain-containing protein [Bacteroidota bacterium]
MEQQEKTAQRIFFLGALAWCTGIIAAPFFESHGFHTLASILYELYGKICHQHSDSSLYFWGQPLAVCIRCTAIYWSFCFGCGILLFISHLSLKRNSVPPLWILYSVAALMLVDVFLSITHIHPSNTITRIVTGCLLGLTLPWYLFPIFTDAVTQQFSHKPQRIFQ